METLTILGLTMGYAEWAAAILAASKVADLIVRATPTEVDNRAMAHVRRVLAVVGLSFPQKEK